MNISRKARVNAGGNYCGHNQQSPSFALAIPFEEDKPKILAEAAKRLQEVFFRRDILPSLRYSKRTASGRQQRGESCAACIILLSTLLKFCELASLRVGVPEGNLLGGISLKTLAKHSGMTLRRVRRAMWRLQVAGLVTMTRPLSEQRADGTWESTPAVKSISKDLFGALGMKLWLERERKKASDRLANAGRRLKNMLVGDRARARGNLFLSSLRGTLPRKQSSTDSEALRRRELDIALENPGLSRDEVRRLARRSFD